MKDKVDIAEIFLWNNKVGAVAWDSASNIATFEYDRSFLNHNWDIAPLWMPIDEARQGGVKFLFPALNRETFKGLPGLLADCLPDNYGNRMIDIWLAKQGRSANDFSPVERLCYMGKRSMGALEFRPAIRAGSNKSVTLEIDRLVSLAKTIVDQKSKLNTILKEEDSDSLMEIIKVGTSAGGNRSKAVIAFNEKTNQVKSGQLTVENGFEHWILKFDGVNDKSLGDPKGYGLIEYVYYQMATSAGIHMNECRLLREKSRAHFMTKRFDRVENHQKLHMQTLCAIAHFDYNEPGGYSYEQAFEVMRKLKLPYDDLDQMFRRMVFNVVARNQDDHTKNISFLMDSSGTWKLSPAYDVIYANNLNSGWTSKHQMLVNGKQDDFDKEDLIVVGKNAGIKSSNKIVDEIIDAVSQWPVLAKKQGIDHDKIKFIKEQHRMF